MANLSLNLSKVTDDTIALRRAVALANAEEQLAEEDSRDELKQALWAAEGLVEELNLLSRRSDDRLHKIAQEKRYQDMLDRRSADRKAGE